MNNNFSQEELREFFYHIMNENESKKIDELDARDMISKIETSTYQIKYIENVGYIFIGEGYLIMEDCSEPTHYFLHHVFENPEDAKAEIIRKYEKK